MKNLKIKHKQNHNPNKNKNKWKIKIDPTSIPNFSCHEGAMEMHLVPTAPKDCIYLVTTLHVGVGHFIFKVQEDHVLGTNLRVAKT